jgi:hypothetical protein
LFSSLLSVFSSIFEEEVGSKFFILVATEVSLGSGVFVESKGHEL